MEMIEMIFLGLISVALIFMIISLFYGVNFFRIGKKLNRLKKRRVKNKKQKKRLKRELFSLRKQKKRMIKSFLICLVLGFSLLGGYIYLKDYMSKNLAQEDMKIVMRAYFLIRDYETELKNAKDSVGEAEEVSKNLADMSNKMSSYMVETPSDLISADGQRLLNRYYKNISELGVNTVPLNKLFYGNAEGADEYIANIENIKQKEKDLFDYFKIDESRIKEK